MAAYQIDSRRGSFTVKAFAEGLLSSFGHNPTLAARTYSGRLDFDENSPDVAALQVMVDAQSLEVTDQVNKRDRQEIESRTRNEVLEVGQYPEIAFASTAISATKVGESQYRLQIKGKFKLHGVQQDQAMDVQLRAGESDARLRGEMRIKQSDYGIQRISALGGTIRVKDELLIAFELLAKRVEA